MKYVLLILDTPNEPAADSAEYGAWYAEVGAWYEKWGATGRLDGGHQLQGVASAKTIRSGSVTDGPFIETKEALAGVFVIEARDLDHALALARMTPVVDGGVEVRPLLGFQVPERT